jgi:hypothetical protein
MKQLPSIRSVQSKVRFVETELKRIITKQVGNTWLWKRNANKPAMIVDGFATLSTFSITVPLSGTIEIAFLADKGKVVTLQVPSSTHFFVTCINRNDSPSIPAFAVSLS